MFDRDKKTNVKSTVVILTLTSLLKHQVEFLKLMGITARCLKGRGYCQIGLGPTNSNSIIMSRVAFTDSCCWKLTFCTEIERCFLASFRMLGPVFHIIFWCFRRPVALHKLNFEFASQTSLAAHASNRLFFGRNKDQTQENSRNRT